MWNGEDTGSDTALPDERRAIIETGRALDSRLDKELARTERAHVPVYHHTPDGQSEHLVT